MELSFNELKKRDVVNVADGRCLGRMTDLELKFPEGVMNAIIVPGRNDNCLVRLFTRSKLRISVKNIVKIGGDVILVNLSCGDMCADSVKPKKPPLPPPPNGCCGERFDLSDYDN